MKRTPTAAPEVQPENLVTPRELLDFLLKYISEYRKECKYLNVVDAPEIVKRVRRRQLVYEGEFEVCGFRGCQNEAVTTGLS